MKIIHKNPYRILGLPITAKEKNIRKRIDDLELFSEMGKPISYDTDLPFLPDFKRTPETIKEAASQIERPEDKAFYSLFWFWIKNPVDEFVFDILKEGKVEKAIELWEKSLNGDETNKDNSSILRNLSVLYMATASDHKTINENYLSRGIELSGTFFASGDINKYSNLIAGNKYKIDEKKIQREFIDKILTFAKNNLDKPRGIPTGTFVGYFQSFPDESYQYVVEKYTSRVIKKIESEIDNTKQRRKENPLDCYFYGTELNDNTNNDLEYLKTILPRSDYHLELITDKIAEEILLCSVDLYKAALELDNQTVHIENSLNLTKIATKIAIGERTKQNLNKDLLFTENYIKERRKVESRNNIIDIIVKELKSIPENIEIVDTRVLLSIAKKVADKCKPNLIQLKNELQMDDNKLPSVVFEEDFADNTNKWILSEDEDCSFTISDGTYILENWSDKSSWLTWPERVFGFGSMADFTIKCKLKQIEEDSNYGFGIIWGYEKSDEGNKYHYFRITNNGYYACGYYNLNLDDLEWKNSPYIKNLEFNTLAVMKKGRRIEYYINERYIDVHDLTYVGGSKIGLSVGPEQTVHVDHIYFCDSYISNFEALKEYEYYLDWSSAVASQILNICIVYVNRTQEYKTALGVMKDIASLDMSPELRKRFDENNRILGKNWLNQFIAKAPPKNDTLCYIATMVYGNVDEPEVKILREYRDRVLRKYALGRLFIKIYYRYSPSFVSRFRNSVNVNRVIRFILDKIVGRISV